MDMSQLYLSNSDASSVELTDDFHSDTDICDTISSRSSTYSTIQEISKPLAKQNALFDVIETTSNSHELINDSHNYLMNTLDCIEDMINDENNYLLGELQQLVDDIKNSVPYNSYTVSV
jgi:hypothetical protein